MTRIIAVMPAHNEEPYITRIVSGAHAHLPVLVVNDGSTDDTAALAEKAGATVLHQSPNRGKGVALRTGFRYAVDEGYDAAMALDADGQHDPAEIPKFLHAFHERGADLTIGARTFTEMPFVRRLANSLGTYAFSWAVRQQIPDNQSGYRLISRRMLQATLNSSETGFEFEVEMIVTCIERGYTLDWVPIRTIYADETSHIHPWQHTVNFFRLVWQTRRRLENGRLQSQVT